MELCHRGTKLVLIKGNQVTQGFEVDSFSDHVAYRFIVIYRCEPREIPGADGQWRGSVVPIPESGENAQNDTRMGFSNLDEIPALIGCWVNECSEDSNGS